MKTCFKCGKPIETEKVSFREECRGCGSDVHVCLNCVFYEPGRSNDCREPQAERVREKDRANYCDFFRFKETETNRSGRSEADKLWNELFKKR